MKKMVVLPVSNTSYNVTDLNAGETYNITVKAVTIGNVIDRSAASEAILETTGKWNKYLGLKK